MKKTCLLLVLMVTWMVQVSAQGVQSTDSMPSLSSVSISTEQLMQEYQRMENANIAVGKAFKTTGTVSLSVGVPLLAAGVATGIASINTISIKNAITSSLLGDASLYLTGAGIALVTIGIPMYVHGKKILDMNVKYTGTGAGMSIQF